MEAKVLIAEDANLDRSKMSHKRCNWRRSFSTYGSQIVHRSCTQKKLISIKKSLPSFVQLIGDKHVANWTLAFNSEKRKDFFPFLIQKNDLYSRKSVFPRWSEETSKWTPLERDRRNWCARTTPHACNLADIKVKDSYGERNWMATEQSKCHCSKFATFEVQSLREGLQVVQALKSYCTNADEKLVGTKLTENQTRIQSKFLSTAFCIWPQLRSKSPIHQEIDSSLSCDQNSCSSSGTLTQSICERQSYHL